MYVYDGGVPVLAIENLELVTFSNQAHNEECSKKFGEVLTKIQFL